MEPPVFKIFGIPLVSLAEKSRFIPHMDGVMKITWAGWIVWALVAGFVLGVVVGASVAVIVVG
jgi:hypothetical protein